VVGSGRAGILALLAAAIDGGVASLHADLDNFDTASDAAWVSRYYIPSIRSIGDLATAGILLAPAPVSVTNAHTSFPQTVIRDAYRAAGAEDRFKAD
jgi:hypothetical protein